MTARDDRHTPHTHIGISGWRYAGWRGTFYPQGLRQADELAFASRAVQTIEINGTHYSLQSPSSYRQWYEATPDRFVFSLKGARYLTHMLRFRDDDALIACANFFAQGLLQLNEKLGPILWQFPPSFKFEPDTMARFLSLLPRDTEAALALAQHHDKRVKQPWLQIDKRRPLRHAVEIRHESFLVPDFVKLLRKHAVALVISDSTENWPHVEDVTADFVYLRLHGTQTRYAGAYEDAALDDWARRIACWAKGGALPSERLIAPSLPASNRAHRDVFCYFDNDQKTQAPFDAQRLIERLGQSVPAAAIR